MKNYADQGGCNPPRQKAKVMVDNILQHLPNSSHSMEAKFINFVIIHLFLTSLPPHRLSPELWPILGTVSQYKQKKQVDNIHRSNVLHFLAAYGQKFSFIFAFR